jgi:hypothetical protein
VAEVEARLDQRTGRREDAGPSGSQAWRIRAYSGHSQYLMDIENVLVVSRSAAEAALVATCPEESNRVTTQALESELLQGAPLRYAPNNEMGVVFLFSHLYRRMQLHVESVQAGFPDCIALQRVGGKERRIRIEFEFRSSNFRAHGHPPDGCDCVQGLGSAALLEKNFELVFRQSLGELADEEVARVRPSLWGLIRSFPDRGT